MNALLCSCDTYGGSGMRNTCSTAGELKQTISSLRAQVAELKADLDEFQGVISAIGVAATGYDFSGGLVDYVAKAFAERDELKVQLAEYKADAAPEGYVFLSADFSRQAAGHSQFGIVTFIRNKVGRQWWHELPEEQQEITSLHMYGKGTTVIEAMRHAAMKGATE